MKLRLEKRGVDAEIELIPIKSVFEILRLLLPPQENT
jgi:hypothetical protein